MIYTLDVPPIIVEENGESRTLVPVRAISESLGFVVKWDPDTATAMIYDFRDTEVEDSTFARRLIGSMPIDYDTYTYFRSYASKELGAGSSEFLENEENKTLLEETADEYLKYYYSVLHLAASLGMSKYDPEVINTVNSAFEEYKSFYGPAFDEVLAENGMTEKLFKDLLYASLFEKEIFDGYSVIASEMTAEQKTKELLQDPSLIRVSHILVDSREVAESLLEEAKSASDDEFYEMTQEYGKDNGMDDNKDGYYFTPDHMLPEFEAAAYSLEIGETSDIVKSKYGYHIIRRLPLDMDYISRNTDGLYVLKAESDYYSMIDQLSDILVIHKFDE